MEFYEHEMVKLGLGTINNIVRWILWFTLFNRTHSSGENGISMWYWRRVVVILFRGSYRPDFQLWAWTCYKDLIKSFQARVQAYIISVFVQWFCLHVQRVTALLWYQSITCRVSFN